MTSFGLRILSKQFWSWLFFLLALFSLVVLILVAGIKLFCCRCCWSCWRQFFFFSRWAFVEASKLLKRCRAMNNLGLRTLDSSTQEFFINWPWLLPWLLALAVVVWASQGPRGQVWFMLQVVAQSQQFALALVTIIFFTICIKLSSSRFLFCSLAKIKSRRSSPKYLSIISFVKTLIRSYSNKIDCKCLR